MDRTIMGTALLCTVLVGCSSLGSSFQRAETESDVLLKRLRQEAPLGWARWEKWIRNIEITGIIDESQGNQSIRKASLHFVASDSGSRACEGGLDKTGAEIGNFGLFAMNDSYGFWLQKPASHDAWRLHLLQIGEPGRKWIRKELATRYFFAVSPQTNIDPDFPLLDTLDNSAFRWQRAESLTDDRGTFIKVHYSRTKQLQGVKDPVSYEGHCIFDPSNHWACVEWFSRALPARPPKGVPKRALVEMFFSNQPIDGVRPLNKYQCRVRWDDDAKMDSLDSYCLDFTAKAVEQSKADESSFFLSGFGLAEPDGVQRKSKYRTLVWAMIAVGLFGLITYLGWSRKNNATVSRTARAS